MATHTLAATNSPQIQVSLCLSSSANHIMWTSVLVLGRNIPTFQLKCMIRSSAHRLQQHYVLKHVMNALPATSMACMKYNCWTNLIYVVFSTYAFMSETPREGILELATTIIGDCCGLSVVTWTNVPSLF